MDGTRDVQIRVGVEFLNNLDAMARYLGRTRSDLFRIGAEMLRLRALDRIFQRGGEREYADPDDPAEQRHRIEELLAELEQVYEPIEREQPMLR